MLGAVRGRDTGDAARQGNALRNGNRGEAGTAEAMQTANKRAYRDRCLRPKRNNGNGEPTQVGRRRLAHVPYKLPILKRGINGSAS